MKKLVIGNVGIMDAGLGEIALMGASTKRADMTKIGKFGTGNKYAIAYLLRNDFKFKIYSNLREITVNTEPVKVKEQIFEVICFDDFRSGYTTELGYRWELWQAIRELYSNALDEGLLTFDIVEDFEPQVDSTAFVIDADDRIMDFWLNRHSYFLLNEVPLWSCEIGEIYEKRGKSMRVFNNKISCVEETEEESLFDYNFYDLELSEDRIIKYHWELGEHILKLLAKCDDPVIIRAVLNNIGKDKFYEHKMEGVYWLSFSSAWKDEIVKAQIYSVEMAGWLNDEEKIRTFLLPGKLYSMLVESFGNEIKPKSLQFSDSGAPYVEGTITDFRAKVIADALDFFTDARFKFDYKIHIVDFREKNIRGSIDKENNQVLIAITAVDEGMDMVVNVCIEEYVHLKWGVADLTRGFQNSVISEFINYMKEVILLKTKRQLMS